MDEQSEIWIFFKEFEEKTNIKLPINITKTLCAMGYDKHAIGHVDASTLVDEIQDTVRNIMPSVISDNEKVAFFGPLFKENPKKICFLWRSQSYNQQID